MGEYLTNDAVSVQERLNYWNDLVCHTFVRLQVTPLSDGPYFGAIYTDQLAFIRFSEVNSTPSLVTRPKSLIAQTAEAYVQVIYQRLGESVFNQAERTAYLGPGDWVFLDCMQPYTLQHQTGPFKHLVIQFPRRIFDARLPNIEFLTGYSLSSKSGLGKITYDLVQSTLREIAGIKPEPGCQLAETLVDLLATNLTETLYPAKAAKSQAVTLLEVKSFIQRQLPNPELSVSTIAQALNISKSYLHLLFRGENITVSRYIWDLRLEKCRAALVNPRRSHQTITDIAFSWGFNNSTHFCRLFKERYGLSARAFRHRSRLTERGPLRIAGLSLRGGLSG
jgi:AraC-like DNA-binding protein